MTNATLTDPTASTGVLDPAAQALIDTRLDTIDRMLMSQVPRADRLAIVREVEAQLYDHLGDRNPDDTDRDAVLAAIGRLDPPEAYLPDEGGIVPRPVASTSQAAVQPIAGRLGGSTTSFRLGKVSGILGVVSIALLFPTAASMWIVITGQGPTHAPFFSFTALNLVVIITSLLAVIFAACAQLKSTSAMVGLTTGIIALLPGLAGVVMIVMQLSYRP